MQPINVLYAIFVAMIIVFVTYMVLDGVSATGPNCPAPVPSDWLGYCGDWQGQ